VKLKLRKIGLRLALFLVLATSPLITAAVHAFVIGAPAPVISGEAGTISKPLYNGCFEGPRCAGGILDVWLN
jgi:hypothetical protein